MNVDTTIVTDSMSTPNDVKSRRCQEIW